MKKISAVVIAFNEEKKIGRALESLRPVADEIVVVDSLSEDRTPEICRGYTERLIRRPWPGYRAQKQFAADQARFEWALSLDADEVLSPELQQEIIAWKAASGTPANGYQLPRLTHFMGRWIRHTSWYPDWQLRLFQPECGRWVGGRLHEGFEVDGAVGRFRHHIHHYTYSDIGEYLEQLNRFSSLAAADSQDRGRTFSKSRMILKPPLVFLQNYFLKRGFLDGIPGLTASGLCAVSAFMKDLKLWELERVDPTESTRSGEAETTESSQGAER